MSYWYDNITTETRINAPPEKIYSILTDFAAFPSWNPFIVSIFLKNDKPLAVGSPLSITLNTNHKNDGSPPSTMGFAPKLTWVQENVGISWLGSLLIGGIFDGTHKFEIKPDPSGGGCIFEHSESFGGFTIWLGRKTGAGWYTNLMENTKTGFTRMNHAIKERAEQN